MTDAPGDTERRWPETWSAAADEADILACFRLLLGRWPHGEEWRGHSMQAGQPLERVVAGYLGALEFARRGLLGGADLGSVSLTELPEFKILTEADDAAVGQLVRADSYEREVAAVFRRLLGPGQSVIDIGANIGYFSLLSAHLVGSSGSVLAVEPNGRNARLLEASRQANDFDQLRVVQLAASTGPGTLRLNRTHSNGTTSALPGAAAGLLDAETVGCAAVDGLLAPDAPVHLIKADVEGAEYLALSGCRATIARCRPALICEFSPSLMPGISGIDGPGFLHWLCGLGYRLSVIMPDGSTADATPAGVMEQYAARGSDHLDLLCRPEAPAPRRRSWRERLRRPTRRAEPEASS